MGETCSKTGNAYRLNLGGGKMCAGFIWQMTDGLLFAW
jgi:hypothetical protein